MRQTAQVKQKKMKNNDKTREQLLKDLEKSNKRIAELEKFEAGRRKAEEALRESEAKYRELYSMMRLMSDNLPDLIWTKDMEGKFLFVNKACSEILLNARDTDEPIGKTDIYFADRMMKSHPEIPDYLSFGIKCIESDLTVLKTRKPMRFDESGNIKGEFLFLDVFKAPFYDENEDIIGIVGCAKVVTKERQMEKTLQESEEQYRSLTNALPQFIYRLDKDLKYVSANKAYCKAYGISSKEIKGKTSRDIFPKELAEQYMASDRKIIETEKMQESTEKNRSIGDKDKWVHVTKLPVKDNKGNVNGMIGIYWDITERKQAEEELKKYREHLEELVKERTAELEEKNKELKRFNSVFVDREFRIKELKDKVKELEEKLSS